MSEILDLKSDEIVSAELTQAAASVSPNQVPQQKPKWLVILLFVIITLLLFGGMIAYFQSKQNLAQTTHPVLQPSVNEIEPTTTVDNVALDWQTYRNEEYGFEFKYPPFWIDKTTKCLQSKCGLTDDISFFGEDFPGTEPGGPAPLTFTVSQSLGDRPITIDPESTIINKENIFIDGTSYPLTTYKRFEVEGSEEISDSIEIPKGDKTLYLIFSHITDGCLWSETSYPKEQCQKWNQEKLTEYRNLRNQILSTVLFTANDSSRFVIGQDNTEFIKTYIGDIPSGQTIGVGNIAVGLSSGNTLIADVIVTTPDGLKVGFDPRINTTYKDLRDCASITVDQISADDDSGIVSDPVLWFYTNCVKDGTYTIQIIGKNPGSYSLHVIGYGEQASNQSDIADKLIRDELDTYTFTYSSEFGFRKDLVKVN